MNDQPQPPRAGGIIGLSFIIGMALAAWLLGHAALSYKRLDEYVTVKGLSEREVPANLVVWPVTFNLSDENLGKLQEKLVKSRETVHAFLKESGFPVQKNAHQHFYLGLQKGALDDLGMTGGEMFAYRCTHGSTRSDHRLNRLLDR